MYNTQPVCPGRWLRAMSVPDKLDIPAREVFKMNSDIGRVAIVQVVFGHCSIHLFIMSDCIRDTYPSVLKHRSASGALFIRRDRIYQEPYTQRESVHVPQDIQHLCERCTTSSS